MHGSALPGCSSETRVLHKRSVPSATVTPDEQAGIVVSRSRIPQGRFMSAVETDLRLLSSLYETVAKPDGWATFLDALARSYGGGKASLSVKDAGAQHLIKASGQWEPEQVAQYNQYHAATNPWQNRVGEINEINPRLAPASIPVGLATPSEQVRPHAEVFKTEHYNDFLRPAQVDQAVARDHPKNDLAARAINVLFPQVTAERDPYTSGPAATPGAAYSSGHPVEPAIGGIGDPGHCRRSGARWAGHGDDGRQRRRARRVHERVGRTHHHRRLTASRLHVPCLMRSP